MAALTRLRLNEFAESHATELDQLPNIRDGLAEVGRAPQTPDQLVAANNNITQAAMYAVTSKRDKNRWLMQANQNELFLDKELGDWRVPLMGTPTHKRLKLTNQAVRGHLRWCLMMPEPDGVPTCDCLKQPATRVHILACSKNNISQQTETHNLVRDVMNDFCRASGVHPGKTEPRAVSGSSAGFKGGADGKTTGVSKAKAGDSTTLLWDVTFPSSCAPSRRTRLGDNKRRGAAAAQEEFRKRKDNEYAAIAERNNWDFYPACILKDTCFLGQGTKDLINRIAGHRHGDTFASEGYNDEMFKAGVFSAPRAKAYWKRALLVTMINAREKAIAEGKARALAGTN